MLALITCFYNPAGYNRIRDNYWAFRAALPPGVKLFTVELSFDGTFMVPDSIRVNGGPLNLMWQKERLLNIALEELGPEFDSVAWLDADLIWLNSDWFNETRRRLEMFPVVQLFERVIDTDRNGNQVEKYEGHAYSKTIRDAKWRRPGGAWAARLDALPKGFHDTNVMGGSDSVLVAAWEGAWNAYCWGRMNVSFRRHALRWAVGAFQAVRGNIGYVPGEVIHLYHGTRENRNYVNRYLYLTDHLYDPDVDIRIDENRLWAWSSPKPVMHAKVKSYFSERKEDD